MSDSPTCPQCGSRLPHEGASCLGCLLLGGLEEAEPVQSNTGTTNTGTSNLGGREIGAYRVGEKIAEGGTAEVYRARQLQPVTRDVAFKLIKPGMDSEGVVARFDAERQLLARLQHPNIATVLDAGRTEEGRPFFVMEFVDGKTITEFAASMKLGRSERLELFKTVCAAVQHAHQRGIIHRDLKPSNILVDQNGQPKVIDFGIARAMEGELEERTLFLTREGDFLGTPAYMSPEQARGQIAEIDTRSDVYSLGMVLYELLTGRLPFDHVALSRAGLIEAQRIVTETEIRRPSTCETTTEIAPGALRGDLDWIVMKALEKNKDRRYDGAAALADDISRHLANEPVSAGPPSVVYRMQKFVRKHRSLVAGTVVAIIALIAATGISISQAVIATKAREQAETSARAATAAEQRTRRESEARRAVNDFLVHDLLGGVDIENDPNPQITVLEMVDRAAAKTDERFADKPEVAAAVHLVIGDVYLSLGRYDDAFDHLSRGREFNAEQPDSESVEMLRQFLRKLSIARLRQRRLPESRELLEEFIKVSLAAGIPESELLPSRMQMASQIAMEGRALEAIEILRGLIEQLTGLKGPDDHFTLQAKFNLGLMLVNVGQAEEAVPLLEEYLHAIGEVETLDRSSALTELGRIYHALGRIADAEKQFTEALGIQRKLIPINHPQHLNTQASLASLYDETDRIPQAIELYNAVIKNGLGEQGQAREQGVVALHNLGVLVSGSDLDEAERLMRRAIKERSELFGPGNPSTLESRDSLGLILFQQGRYEQAEAEWLAVETGNTEVLGAGHPVTLRSTRLLATNYFVQGHKDEGIQRCRKLLTEPLPEHPGLAEQLREQRRRTVVLIGSSLGDDTEAKISLLREALEVDPWEKSQWLALGEALAVRFAKKEELADIQCAAAALLFAGADLQGKAGSMVTEWIAQDPAAEGFREEPNASELTLKGVLECIPGTALEITLGAESKALKALLHGSVQPGSDSRVTP